MIEEIRTRIPNTRRFGYSFYIDLDNFDRMHKELKVHAIERQAEIMKLELIEKMKEELL